MASHYTIDNQLNLITSAYFDLFSVKNYKPTAKNLRQWLIRYRRRETFKQDLRRKDNEKNN